MYYQFYVHFTQNICKNIYENNYKGISKIVEVNWNLDSWGWVVGGLVFWGQMS